MKLAKKDIQPILIGGGIIAALYIVTKTLQKVGIVDDAEDRFYDKFSKKAQTGASNTNPWNTQYWREPFKNGGKTFTLDIPEAKAKAKSIYDSLGFFTWDDEAKVIAVFSALKYKSQVSFLADQFYKLYKLDLFNYIEEYLDQKDINIILKNVEQKPTGWVK